MISPLSDTGVGWKGVTITGGKQQCRLCDRLVFACGQGGVGGGRGRNALATVSGPVLTGYKGQCGSVNHRGDSIQIGGGLASNTRHSGSGRTTSQWSFHRGDRAC
jgi:hypothetical protein